MTLPSSTDLLDANVWLALVAEAHAYHRRAEDYWNDAAAQTVAFCRVTQLALLRHLTNKAIMGANVLAPSIAWRKCREFLALPEVRLLAEPDGVNEELGQFCDLGRTSPNLWTDAYLAAFAKTGGMRLVTFDRGFSAFSGLDVLLLKAQDDAR